MISRPPAGRGGRTRRSSSPADDSGRPVSQTMSWSAASACDPRDAGRQRGSSPAAAKKASQSRAGSPGSDPVPDVGHHPVDVDDGDRPRRRPAAELGGCLGGERTSAKRYGEPAMEAGADESTSEPIELPLVLLSHRGPVSFGREGDRRTASKGSGGLVTALLGLAEHLSDAVWVCAAASDEDAAVAREAGDGDVDVVTSPVPHLAGDRARRSRDEPTARPYRGADGRDRPGGARARSTPSSRTRSCGSSSTGSTA